MSSQIQGGAEMQAKKVRILMSGLTLVVGLMLAAAPAFAQGVAFQASSLPQQARFEGTTETMGAVVLQATGTGKIPGGSSITLVYSATITNAPSIAVLSGSFGGVPCTAGGCTGGAGSTAGSGFTVTASGNQLTVQFNGTTAVFTGFATGDYIVISQVRVNVNSLGAGATTVTATMSGTSSLPTTNPITFTQAVVPVASIVNPSVKASIGSAGTKQTCSISAGTFTVKIAEQYPAALTSTADETAFTPTVPPAPANGSNVAVTLAGIPSGISVQFAGQSANTPGTSTIVFTVDNAGVVTSTGGNITFNFVVTGDSTAVAEGATLSFTIGTVNSSSVFVTGSLASLGTTVTPTATVSLVPQKSTSVPITPASFAANTIGTGTIITLGDCVTNLLFSFMTNELGFDTTFAIANTTSDDLAFGTGAGAASQSGTCTLSMYASSIGAGTTTTTGQITTPTIAAGGVYVFQQSTTTFAGKSGYLFAVCRFLDAHGFSYVVNGSGPSATISQGLLALVIQTVGATSRLGNPTGVGNYEALLH